MDSLDKAVADRGSSGLAASACVRIWDRAGEVVGAGFLVGPDLVATCAHVVAEALGGDPYSSTYSAEPLRVDFPVATGGPSSRWAVTHRWVPIADDGSGDVALLRLDSPAPPGAVMPPLRRVDGLWGHAMRTFGFPAGRVDGVWTTGAIRADQGTGWVQLQATQGDHSIEGGFSGSPIWDEATGAVVGMTVAADRDPSITTAYLIPIEEVLGLDPELLPNPYRGMEPFGEEHTEFYFGREPDIQRLRDVLGARRLVAVAGPSGVGKSSLVRAGLFPKLRAHRTRIAELRPQLAESVARDLVVAVLGLVDPGSTPARRARDAGRITAALADPSTRDHARGELAEAARGCDERALLYVDQFEELAEANPPLAAELLDTLVAIASGAGDPDADRGLRVVLTVRALAVDAVYSQRTAEVLGPGTVFLGPLDRARLRDAIVRPAERAPGLIFEPGLVDRILDDAGSEPSQLPLVGSLLARLWERRDGGTLTSRAYEDAGGVAGALAAHAEQVVSSLRDVDFTLEQTRRLLTRLLAPGAEGRFVRRAIQYSDLPDQPRLLVPRLVGGRLLVLGSGRDASTVELAHQALAEHWPRLRGWLEADREFLRWRAQLDLDRQRWLASRRDDAALLRGALLGEADRWTLERTGELTTGELDYLHRSRTRRRAERRRRRAVAALCIGLLGVAGVLTIIAVRGQDRISAQEATARADELGRAATDNAARDPVLAAELAVAAWRSDPHSAAARTGLAGTYLGLAMADAVLAGSARGPAIMAIGASPSPSGGTVGYSHDLGEGGFVTGVTSTAPKRWELPKPTGLREGSLSPDGRRYAVVTEDGALRLWTIGEATAPEQLNPPGGERAAASPSFSPDSRRLGWLITPPGGPALFTVYDLTTKTTQSVPIGLPSDAESVLLTTDPDRVMVRIRQGPDQISRTMVRSLAGNVTVRELPAGAITGGDATGHYFLTCARAGTADSSGPGLVTVSDMLTGAELRRIPLLTGPACRQHWVTADGGYLLEAFTGPPTAQQTNWRTTHVATGKAYQFTTPPLNPRLMFGPRAAWIGIVPDAEGKPVAVVAAGAELLRVRVTQEPAVGSGAPPRRYFEHTSGSFVTWDPSSNRVSASPAAPHAGPSANLPIPLSPVGKVLINDGLWIIDRSSTGWSLIRYDLPTLAEKIRIPLPGGVEASTGRNGFNLAFGGLSGQPPRTVTVILGGQLSMWDATTGQALGEPVTLASSARQMAWFANRAGLWPRIGHPHEVLVATGTDRLQLWDVPGRRLIREWQITLLGRRSVAAAGDRLAVATIHNGLELWNLATGERTSTGMPVPGPNLAGFDSTGYLVIAADVGTGENRTVLYDLERESEASSFVTAAFGDVRVDQDQLTIDGPFALAPPTWHVSAEKQQEHLCRLLPHPPAATDRERCR